MSLVGVEPSHTCADDGTPPERTAAPPTREIRHEYTRSLPALLEQLGVSVLTSDDAQAVLPANYAFAAGDAGVHTFSATLKTAGTRSLTVTDLGDARVSGAQSVTVNPAATSRLLVRAPSSVNAGAAFSLTVSVVDSVGNVVSTYRGTIAFRSSSAGAKLPRSYRFTAADRGVHTFSGLMLKRRGRQTITVTDTRASSLTGSVVIEVL